jgi:hypothetical protein
MSSVDGLAGFDMFTSKLVMIIAMWSQLFQHQTANCIAYVKQFVTASVLLVSVGATARR